MAVAIDAKKCNGCGLCRDVCPVGGIKIEDGKAVISEECIECGACVSECPNGAISFL